MILRVTRQQFILFLLACTIVLGMFYFGYLFVLQPLKQKAQSLSGQLETERRLLAELTNQFGERRQLSKESVIELQKQLPTKPLLDQFLIDLEKAEVVSKSSILSMSFGENDEGTGEQSNDQNEENEVSDPPTSSLPEGIEKITVTLEVQSSSYYQLEEFIEALEGTNRIITVESLAFTGNEELITEDQPVAPLRYSLKVSALYYPKLEELKDKISELEIPKPAEKTSPLFEIAEQIDE